MWWPTVWPCRPKCCKFGCRQRAALSGDLWCALSRLSLLERGCGERCHAFDLHEAALELVFVVLSERDGAEEMDNAVFVGDQKDGGANLPTTWARRLAFV